MLGLDIAPCTDSKLYKYVAWTNQPINQPIREIVTVKNVVTILSYRAVVYRRLLSQSDLNYTHLIA